MAETITRAGDRAGIRFRETPGHGYLVIPAELNDEIHPALRRANRNYEEDCEWALAVLGLADRGYFTDDAIADAHKAAWTWFPDDYRKAFPDANRDPAESIVLRDRAFAEAHVNDWVTIAAFGRAWWLPDGSVAVLAKIGGRDGAKDAPERMFVVLVADYHSRGGTSYVVPPGTPYVDPLPEDSYCDDKDRVWSQHSKWRQRNGISLRHLDQLEAGERIAWPDQPTFKTEVPAQ